MTGTTRIYRALPLVAALLAVLLAAGPRAAVAAERLVADLDDHLVAITTGFTGTELLLFGSIQGEGEVVVVVHGPKEELVVRRKDRVAGIWVNREERKFRGVPAFYHVATSSDPGTLDLPRTALDRHRIGVDHLNLRLQPGEPLEDRDAFAEAIVRNKIRVGHYGAGTGRVQWRGGRLFRTTVLIPANVPVGTYTIETLLVADGEVVSAQTTPLFVNKEGFGAQVFRTAHNYSMLYGIGAILIAGLAGLAASWAFRKY